jgi:hypothetical protein
MRINAGQWNSSRVKATGFNYRRSDGDHRHHLRPHPLNGAHHDGSIEVAAGHLSILIPAIYGLVKEWRLASGLTTKFEKAEPALS